MAGFLFRGFGKGNGAIPRNGRGSGAIARITSTCFVLLVWVCLFYLVKDVFRAEPLVSRGEDLVLQVVLVALVAIQIFWKRLEKTPLPSLCIVFVWLFLFVVSFRDATSQEIFQRGWLLSLFCAALWIIVPRLPGARDSRRSNGERLVLSAILLGIVFLVAADGFLVALEPHRVPLLLPQSWWERTGYLWPLTLGLLSTYVLSAYSPARRLVLLVLFVFGAALVLKERDWNRRLRSHLAEARAAVEDGRLALAAERLAEARRWNQRKNLRSLEARLRRTQIQLHLQAGQPLGALFEAKRAIEEFPGMTTPLLRLLGLETLEAVSRLPLTVYNDSDWARDFEPGPTAGSWFLLDRWGRVLTRTGDRLSFAFSDSHQPTSGEEPVDLEICNSGQGAVVLTRSGRFHFRGEVPAALKNLLASARIPARSYVDFELSPLENGGYLLTEMGPIVTVGKPDFILPEEEQIRWTLPVARDLEVTRDGKGLYLLDAQGKVHTLGQTAILTSGGEQPYWVDYVAQDIELLPGGQGIYLMTEQGGIYFVGQGQTRKFFQIPDVLQAIRDWPYARAFKISGDEQALYLLDGNGGISTIHRKQEEPAAVMEQLQRQIAQDRPLEAIRSAESLIALAPEKTAAVMDLLDATFCQSLANAPIDAATFSPAAVDVEQMKGGRQAVILDRWGRLWMHSEGTLSPLKGSTLYSVVSGPATDLTWIDSASAALILYDRGMIEPWGEIPSALSNLLAEYTPGGEGWIDLEVTSQRDAIILANAFGGFRVLGALDLRLPVVGDFHWFGLRIAKDMELADSGDGLYLLDGHGVIHTFGRTELFTKGLEVPYRTEDYARSLILLPQQRGAYVLDRLGNTYPVGHSAATIPDTILERGPGRDFVDFECTPEEDFFTFLESNYRVTTVALGQQGAQFYAEQLEKSLSQGKLWEVFDLLEPALALAVTSQQQEKITRLVSAKWLAQLPECLSSGILSEGQRRRLQSYFSTHLGPFVDLEPSSQATAAYVLDYFGRLYRCDVEHPSAKIELEILDEQPVEDLNQAKARDMVILLDAPEGDRPMEYMILSSTGKVELRGQQQSSQGQALAQFINAHPLSDALDLEVTGDRQGAIVMDRNGHLRTYGRVEIFDHNLQRIGWDGPVARDIELTEDGQGLYLLDSQGAVHAFGRVPIPTRPGETEKIPWFGRDIAQTMTRPSSKGFWMLDEYGNVHSAGDTPFDLPASLRMLFYRSRGEKPVDVESADDEHLFVLTNWGRVDYFHQGPQGAAAHQAWAARADDPLERVRHLYKAIAAHPRSATDVLEKFDAGAFFALPQVCSRRPEDFWTGWLEGDGSSDLLRVFSDILPGPEADQVYVLSRWGQVYQWDVAQQVLVEVLRREPIAQSGQHRAVAFDAWHAPSGSHPSFLIMDSTAALYATGPLPPSLEEAMRLSAQRVLPLPTDLRLSSDGEAAFLLSEFGTISVVGRSAISPEALRRVNWDFPIARSLEVTPTGRGLYLLDGMGAVHTVGRTELPTTGPDVPWFGKDEARALRLDPSGRGLYLARVNGELYFLGMPDATPACGFLTALQAGSGEQLVRMAVDGPHGQLWGLTSWSRILRVPIGERGAFTLLEQAVSKLQSRDVYGGVDLFDQARHLAPLRVQELFDVFSPRLTESLQLIPEWDCANIAVWVDVELCGQESQLWILNRWGEIYSGKPGDYGRRRVKPATRMERAVELLADPAASRALLLYEDGFVEAWGDPFEESLMRAVSEYNRSPVPFPVDLEWAIPGESFYVTSGLGNVVAVGIQPFNLSLTEQWRWGGSVARTLKAATDGQALFLFDHFGGVHVVGQPAFNVQERHAPYFTEPGWAVDIELSPRGDGLYFLDGFGGLHAIGGQLPMPTPGTLPYFQKRVLVDLELSPQGQVIFLTCNGKLYSSPIEQKAERQ